VDGQTDRQTDILITLLCKRYRGGSDYKSLYATDTYFGHTNYNTSTILSSTAGNNTITAVGWLVGWGLTALLTQNRSYCACRFVGIFYSKL